MLAQSVPVPVLPAGESVCGILLALSGPAVGRSFIVGPGAAIIGRGEGNPVEIPDPGISRHHARVVSENGILTIRDLGSSNGTFVDGIRVDHPTPLRDVCRIQLGPETILKFSVLDPLEPAVQKRLDEAIHCDVLTGARNRRYMTRRLPDEFAHAMRHRRALCLLMVDIDAFKRVNDSHGHAAGDAVLRAIAEALAAQLRAEDVVVRYGGEEFLVIARDTTPAKGLELAARLRSHVESLRVKTPAGEELAVTVSIGVSSLDHERDTAHPSILARADAALYRAKAGGRNRVEME